MLLRHNLSVVNALMDLFPNIGLETALFRASWRKSENRRQYIEAVAEKVGIDPLCAEQWHDSTLSRTFLEFKVLTLFFSIIPQLITYLCLTRELAKYCHFMGTA